MARIIQGSWLDFYMQYVEDKASEYPRRWAMWSAITAVAASLKRHVHVIIPKGQWKLYPTTYTVLVGRPGLGKGLAMNDVMPIVKRANTSNIMSGRLTMPFIIDLMSKGFGSGVQQTTTGINLAKDHSVFIWSPELSVFMQAYKGTIEDLTDLWDTIDRPFNYGTMQHGAKTIPLPWSLNLLGGSAPEWLCKAVPHDAVGGGFTRRVNFVYADKKEIPTPHNGPSLQTKFDNLVSDLREISNLQGPFTIDASVLPLLEDYNKISEPDEFDDAATSGYTTTKPAHAMKLAMIHSVARGDSLVISKDDFDKSVALVEAAQEGMQKVFRGIGASNFVAVSDKIIRLLEIRQVQASNPNPSTTYSITAATGQVSKQEFLKKLWQDLNNTAELDMVLQMLQDAGVIIRRMAGRNEVFEIAPKTGKVKARGIP